MKNLFRHVLFVLILCANSLGAASAAEQSDRERWRACSSAQECVPVLDECRGADAVNRQYVNQYARSVAELRPRVDCAYVCYKDEASFKAQLSAGGGAVDCAANRFVINATCPGRGARRP
jgi:hypothetical protein